MRKPRCEWPGTAPGGESKKSSVRVFGSALHGDDTADSDLDLLVELTTQTTMMDIGAIRLELKQLLGIEVDVLTPNSLPTSFRDQVLREAIAV